MRVLVIEDDQEMAQAVATGLRHAKMAADTAFDGLGGLERALLSDYDVIVLDRDLPGMHGDEVCRRLVAAGCRSRVLMLTAAAETEDLVAGLGQGADDYLPKPFDFPVLVARIAALFRRAQPAIPPLLRCGNLVVDTARRTACRAGRRLDLAPREFGVLELLLAAHGRTVSAEELLERVWDENADPFTAAVKITISRLRAKLATRPSSKRCESPATRSGNTHEFPPADRDSRAYLAPPVHRAAAPNRLVRQPVPDLRRCAARRHLYPGPPGLRRQLRGNALCQAPGSGCHVIGAQQARDIAAQQYAAVLHELLSRSGLALGLMAVLSVASGWFIAGRTLRPLRAITAAAREISAVSLSERVSPAPGRAHRTCRHLRRVAGAARGIVQRPAPVHRQRGP